MGSVYFHILLNSDLSLIKTVQIGLSFSTTPPNFHTGHLFRCRELPRFSSWCLYYLPRYKSRFQNVDVSVHVKTIRWVGGSSSTFNGIATYQDYLRRKKFLVPRLHWLGLHRWAHVRALDTIVQNGILAVCGSYCIRCIDTNNINAVIST